MLPLKYLTLHVTILLLLATMPASAQGFDKGFAAYMIGDYATALTEWRRRAELGSVTAQANLGNMYEVGAGVAQSNILAHQWYNLAASNGDATARESREKLVDKMTSAEVSKAVATAKKCMISGYLDCG
jgi:TPR repeat protein